MVPTAQIDRPLVLVADMEATIGVGPPKARQDLCWAFTHRPHSSLIYLTDRNITTARAFQEFMGLPRPDVFIADMGAAVDCGKQSNLFNSFNDELDNRWPGRSWVRNKLKRLHGMMQEQALNSPRRMSYVLGDGIIVSDVLPVAAAMLAKSGAGVFGTANGQIDVLPQGVDKCTTLNRVLLWLGVAQESVLVAASSPTDASLLSRGWCGVVVGNAHPELKCRASSGVPNVYEAGHAGAAGVLEGLVHFGFVGSRTGREQLDTDRFEEVLAGGETGNRG